MYYQKWGNKYIQQGKLREAEQLYRAFLKAHPTQMDAYLRLIELLLRMASLPEAKEIIEAGKKAFSDAAYFHIVDARYHQRIYNYKKAQTILEETYVRFPENINLQLVRAHNYWVLGDHELALTLLDELYPKLDISKGKLSERFIEAYIHILQSQAMHDKLKAFLKKCLAAGIKNGEIIFAYCQLLSSRTQYQGANSFIERQLQSDVFNKDLLSSVLLRFEQQKNRIFQALHQQDYASYLKTDSQENFLSSLEEIETHLRAHPLLEFDSHPISTVFQQFRQLAQGPQKLLLQTAISPDECFQISEVIIDHIRNKKAFALIRLGDGEGHYLPYKASLQSFQAEDQQFSQEIWWGKSLITTEKWQKIKALYHDAIAHANILGIPDPQRICRNLLEPGLNKGELNRESRGLLAVMNTVESLSKTYKEAEEAPIISSCHIHSQLEVLGFWELILAEIDECVLISSHPELPKWLLEKHAVKLSKEYLLPTEYKFAEQMGYDKSPEKPHFPDHFEFICRDITVAYPGQVFIVAAGFLGKMYCHLIRQRGGIALDVGSTADYWLQFKTRRWNAPGPFSSQDKMLYNRLGWDMLKCGNTQLAWRAFEKIAQSLPQDPDGYNGLARLSLLANNLPEARRYWERVLALSPDNKQAMVGKATLAEKNFQREEAASWWEKVISKHQLDLAYRKKAQMLINHAHYQEGIATLDQWIDIKGANAERLMFKAGLLIKAGEYGEAVGILSALHASQPGDEASTQLLAQALVAHSAFESASQLINQLADYQPESCHNHDPTYIRKLLKTWNTYYQEGAGFDRPKIFGIGLSRTGTSSLTEALTLLGYGAIHFINPITQRIIELEDFSYFDAFTDSPVSYRFEELYERFPNAKFIYAERDLADWVRSSQNLYKPIGFSSTQEFRAYLAKSREESGKFEKFCHNYHPNYIEAYQSLYAQFPNWEAAYLAYEQRVERFFADKPDEKLLRINIMKENTWEKLCAFLGKPIPDHPFPHANRFVPG